MLHSNLTIIRLIFLDESFLFGHLNALSTLVNLRCLGSLIAAFPVGHCHAASFPQTTLRQAAVTLAGGNPR